MTAPRIRIPLAPPPSSAAVSAVMRGNAGSNTRPELAVRRVLSQLGYRYRLHARSLPGRPDIYFAGRRKVIFVHGCFWHQHGSGECPLRSQPRSNVSYWEAKLRRNVQRDATNLATLLALGWQSTIVWECEINNQGRLRRLLTNFLGPAKLNTRRTATPRPSDKIIDS
jgi:DNA mismatch endonuclease, patch repair protein